VWAVTATPTIGRSLANLNPPGSEAGTKSEVKISLLLVPVAVAGGILTGTMAEWLLTDIDIAPSELIPVWLISPISLTVGGGHFPFPDYFRPLTSILGLLTFPALIAAIVFACRRRTSLSLIMLWTVTSFAYFGVIHKHLAMMSV
jgi:hypothetical protein